MACGNSSAHVELGILFQNSCLICSRTEGSRVCWYFQGNLANFSRLRTEENRSKTGGSARGRHFLSIKLGNDPRQVKTIRRHQRSFERILMLERTCTQYTHAQTLTHAKWCDKDWKGCSDLIVIVIKKSWFGDDPKVWLNVSVNMAEAIVIVHLCKWPDICARSCMRAQIFLRYRSAKNWRPQTFRTFDMKKSLWTGRTFSKEKYVEKQNKLTHTKTHKHLPICIYKHTSMHKHIRTHGPDR